MPLPVLVTVGIPCFNAGRFLREAIQSALDQNWPNIEVLVMDDGSTDESAEIIRSFGDAIRSERSGNRGGNFARNALLRMARGEWIQFLDADDYLLSAKISAQFAEAGDLGATEMLVGPVWWEDYSNNRARSRVPEPGLMGLDPCRQLVRFQLPQTAGLLWRKSALEQIGSWNEQMQAGQDWELYFRALRSGLRVAFTDSCNAVYRLNWSPQTLGNRRPDRTIEAHLQLFLEMSAWMRTKREWTEQHQLECAPAVFGRVRALATYDIRRARRLDRQLRCSGLWHRRDVARMGWASPRYACAYRWLGLTVAEWLSRRFGVAERKTLSHR